ncbi:hypothetical protein MBANPS3_002673 [Mucor bainieri]
MYSRLPREILEQIFSSPCITKKDLHELQLTCKQWNPVAQRHFYTIVTMKKRLALLIRSLLVLNKRNGKWVKKIHLSSLFTGVNTDDSSEDLILNAAMLLHLCPNATLLIGANFPSKFYQAMPDLHRNGNLRHLEHIKAPEVVDSDNREALISTYHKCILAFKNTIKNFTVFDGVGRVVVSEASIPPAALQHFPCVQNLQLVELSRFHLYRMRDYVSNSPPTVNFIDIAMISNDTERTLPPEPILLPDEYFDPHMVRPKTSVQKLSIRLQSSLTSNEMAFIMRMFPSLNTFTFEMDGDLEWGAPTPDNMELNVQFFDYLFLIPHVDLIQLWFGVSEGLALLPRIANSSDFRVLKLSNSRTAVHAGASITLNRQTQLSEAVCISDTDIQAAYSSLNIDMISDDTPTFCSDALELFKDKSIEILCLGYGDDCASPVVTKLSPGSMDCIINKYTSLQELTLNHIDFVPGASYSGIGNIKHLRRLGLNHCQISENQLFELSFQLEHVDYLKFSTSTIHQLHNEISGSASTVRVLMPYTTFTTIELKLQNFPHYIIKVQARSNCIALKATPSSDRASPGTLEEYDENDKMPDSTVEIVVYCMDFQEVRAEGHSAFYKLP